MFKHLAKFEKILVTGPQRSGTTICAKMIAVDTGHEFLSEASLEGGDSIDFQLERLEEILKTKSNIVVQCPSLSRWIHEFTSETTLIVFMIRRTEDIIASEERIGWDGTKQLSYYDEKSDLPISTFKYIFWEIAQKRMIDHWLEVNYEGLQGHPLWVPKFRRRNFSARQISEDNRFAGEIFLNG